MKRKLSRIILIIGGLAAAGVCLLLALQLVPTEVSTTNPPVVAEPPWDSAQTRALAVRACFDCHSNETQWPLYSRVAPVSLLVAHDVAEGRQALNFSEWGVSSSGEGNHEGGEGEAGEGDEGGERGEGGEGAHEVVEVVQDGQMPPASYVWLHPNARLTPAEQQQLIDGFIKSLR
jgi:hypothetical protein